MYVTNRLVRFQKNEIQPVVDYIFRAIMFLNSDSKIKVFANLLLHFVIRPSSSISGHELRTAFKISDQVKHHELRKPDLKNAKGLYFRRYWVKKEPSAVDEWMSLVKDAATNAVITIWDDERRIASIMTKIKSCGITIHEYSEIHDWMSEIVADESLLPEAYECQIISFPNLEVA